MASLFPRFVSRATLLALVCLLAVVVVSFAGPLHKHDAGQDANCLLCHVGERANVVAIASDAGKPFIAASHDPAVSFKPVGIVEVPDLTRTPRAPPSFLLSL